MSMDLLGAFLNMLTIPQKLHKATSQTITMCCLKRHFINCFLALSKTHQKIPGTSISGSGQCHLCTYLTHGIHGNLQTSVHFPSALSSPIWRVPKFGLYRASAPFPTLFPVSLWTFFSIAVPCSGCRDKSAQSPQGMGVPRFSTESSFPVPVLTMVSVFLAFWLPLPVKSPESSRHCSQIVGPPHCKGWFSDEHHVNLSLTVWASFISHSSSLAIFTSCLHFTYHVFLGFPMCLAIASSSFSLSHARGGRFVPRFSIYVRHFTLASRTVFLSLLGVCRLLGFELLI